ncbi:hypothetical protein I2F27_10060 [Acinetobacter sp. B5B]|uniref:polymorphic toxin type 15 domain-containing protein n=1 Tax=Acinetobacter baretiae TaxID=2605383 RepID=UPI0018C21D19|nr:hypothetical protein [Acinetobacter baretiae]
MVFVLKRIVVKNFETVHQAKELAEKDADAFMKKSAALHEPDMFVGGAIMTLN